MAYYPQSAVGLNYITYPDFAASPGGVTVTAGGSAHTKGSYAEIIASSDFECNNVWLVIRQTTLTTAELYLIDWATGAGGAETIVVPNIPAEGSDPSGSFLSGAAYFVPLAIAISTRIAARSQSTNASATLTAFLTIAATGDVPGISSFDNYGSNTANSNITSVDPGAVANTMGAYVQFTASSLAIIQYLLMIDTLGGNTNPGSPTERVDISTGAGGAEVVLIPEILLVNNAGDHVTPIKSYHFLTYIAASTRIAIRGASSLTDATDRLIWLALITGTAPSEPSGGGASTYAF